MPRRNERKIEVRIVSDASQFDRGFQKAARSAHSLERQLDQASRTGVTRFNGTVDIARSRLTSLVTAIGAGAIAYKGLQAAVELARDSIKSFSDLNESANAVKVSFGNASEGIVELGDTAAERLGLAKSEFNSLSVALSGFARQIAGQGGDVVEVIDTLTSRGSDFASVMNLEVADSLEKFQSGLAGQSEVLRPFGIDLSDATIKAYAYANGIAEAGSQLTETEKVQARYGSLLEQTAQVQGDFANTAGDLANRLRIAKAEFTDTQAAVGEALVPALEKGLDIIPPLIEALDRLVPAITRAGEAAAEATPDATEFIETLPERVGFAVNALGFLKNVAEGVAQGFAAAGNAFQSAFSVVLLDPEMSSAQFQQYTQDIDDMAEAFSRLGNDIALGKLNNAIIDGVAPINAYASVLRDLGREGGIAQQAIQDLATVASLPADAQLEALEFLILNADELALTTQAVDDLQGAYTDLAYAEQQAAEAARPIVDQAEQNRFGALHDLAEDVDEGGRELDENLEKRLKEAADTATSRLDDLEKAIESARSTFVREISLFSEIELPEDVVSPDKALANVQQQGQILARFTDALGTLSGQGLDNVVAELVAKGPSAVGEAEALAGDLTTAFDIEQQLQDNLDLATEGAIIAAFGNQETYASQAQDLGAFLAANVADGFAGNINLGPVVTRALTPGGNQPSTAQLSGARAHGGRVNPYEAYLVGDGGRTEVLTMGNQGGYVYPSVDAYASTIVRGAAGGGTGGTVINMGGIVVHAEGATDPQAVAYKTRREVSREIRNYQAGMDRSI